MDMSVQASGYWTGRWGGYLDCNTIVPTTTWARTAISSIEKGAHQDGSPQDIALICGWNTRSAAVKV